MSELRVTQFIKINQGYFFKNKLTIYTRSCSLDRISTKNQSRLDFILKLHNQGYSNVKITNFLHIFGFKRRNKKDNYKVKDVWVCLKKLKLREEAKKIIIKSKMVHNNQIEVQGVHVNVVSMFSSHYSILQFD